jgi:uncharacterized protein (TIGR02145 family)
MKKVLLLSFIPFLFSCSSDDAENNPTLPVLTTTNTGNITLTTATSGGNITADGGADITARGVVWNTSSNPTISLVTKTTDGTGIGSFTSNLTNLTPNTTYYVRAYATNSVGTVYGNEVTFTTSAIQLPVLTTSAISNITENSASSGGNITSDGGGAITSRGVVWSTTQNPTITLSTRTTDGTGSGAFTSSIANLTPNTQYYVRAYATNSAGTAYGNEITLTTLTPNYEAMYPTGTVFCNNAVTAVVDVTNPVTGKTWMDRNLGASQVATSSTDAAAYGDLYQWGRRADGHQCRNSSTTTTLSSTDQPNHGNFILAINANTPEELDWRTSSNNSLWQGVSGTNNPCPQGYRIPTRNELNNEMLSWNSQNSQGAFNNILKLTPAGIRDVETGQIILNDSWSTGNIGNYWSNSDSPWPSWQSQRGSLDFDGATSNIYYSYKAYGLSVRCIKN